MRPHAGVDVRRALCSQTSRLTVRRVHVATLSRSAMALDELPSPSACARCPRTAPPLTRRRRVRCTRDVLSHARANARTALLVLLSFVHRRVDHSVQQPGGRRVDGAAGRDAQRAPRRAEKALSLARSPAPRPAHCTKPNRTEPMRCAALRCPPPPPPAKRRNNSLPVGFEPASSRSRSGIRTAKPIALVGNAPVCALFVYISGACGRAAPCSTSVISFMCMSMCMFVWPAPTVSPALEAWPPPLPAAVAATPAPADPDPPSSEARAPSYAVRGDGVRGGVRRLPCHRDRRPPACSRRLHAASPTHVRVSSAQASQVVSADAPPPSPPPPG